MSRIRTVKPRLFKHTDLFDAEKESGLPLRLAFIGLFTKADREGRFAWDPRELKTDILPYDEVDFARVLDALATRGFIRKYHVNGKPYGCFPTWKDHQVVNNRENPSYLPSPDEDQGAEPVPTRPARVDDACPTPLKGNKAEGEGEREGSSVPIGTDAGASRPPPELILVSTPLPLSLIEPIDDDWAQTLFRPGLEWLANRTGKPPNALRSVLGKWLQACEQSHERVFRLLIEAERQEIADPIGWITKGFEARNAHGKPRKVDAALAGLAAADFG